MFAATDTDLSDRFPIYTRANVGEVFPDPVSPLTRSGFMWQSELGWRDAFVRMGAFDVDEFPDDQFMIIGVAGGYCYLNASVFRLFGERMPGLTWQTMDEQFFGTQPGIPGYVEMPGDVRPDLTERLASTLEWVFTQTDVDAMQRLTDHRALTIARRANRPDFDTMSDRALWDYGIEVMAIHREVFAEHMFATPLATVPVGVIEAVAQSVGRPALILPLLAGFGQIDSAEPSFAMWALSRLGPASEEFEDGFDRFLESFGSRGPNEWESSSKSWESHPDLALVAIDRMRAAPDSSDPRARQAERAAERHEAASELLALVEGDPATHAQLSAAIASSAAWMPARERTKTNNIRLVHEIRMAWRALGRRFVDRGIFAAVEDFGLLRHDDVDELLGSNPEVVGRRLDERRHEYRSIAHKVPPFVFVGQTTDPTGWEIRGADDVQHLNAGDTLQGLPGCPGVAEGRARVILDSNDPGTLQPGDVLVAPITDPSWTPLFVPAGAVVVDVGAALSHAIIVSRELGIPCVVSATDATRTIRDDSRVRVDGSTGLVTVLD